MNPTGAYGFAFGLTCFEGGDDGTSWRFITSSEINPTGSSAAAFLAAFSSCLFFTSVSMRKGNAEQNWMRRNWRHVIASSYYFVNKLTNKTHLCLSIFNIVISWSRSSGSCRKFLGQWFRFVIRLVFRLGCLLGSLFVSSIVLHCLVVVLTQLGEVFSCSHTCMLQWEPPYRRKGIDDSKFLLTCENSDNPTWIRYCYYLFHFLQETFRWNVASLGLGRSGYWCVEWCYRLPFCGCYYV